MFWHWALYFGLGVIALIPFSARFFIQWILSERKKESHVTRIFWLFSIIGNLLMSLHYLVQIQFHLYMIRLLPLYISSRQWKLMNPPCKAFSVTRLIKILFLLSTLYFGLFFARLALFSSDWIWIKNMQMPWQNRPQDVFWLWHAFGFAGSCLFISRHIVQWWQSEKLQKSVLSEAFWWISLSGGSLTLIYALVISDYVTALGYVTGLVPYARNLMLIYKKKSMQTQGAL